MSKEEEEDLEAKAELSPQPSASLKSAPDCISIAVGQVEMRVDQGLERQ